jgi:hypothetical protein
LAIDWAVLTEWFVVAIVISMVVGITHSFYGATKKGPGYKVPQLSRPAMGYFIQIATPETDSMLLYGEEMLRKGLYDECIKIAFSTAEDVLVQGAAKMGVPSDHSTLSDLGRRLTEAGLLQMEGGELDVLDTSIRYLGQPLTSATATRALGAAIYVRTYFAHAPVKLPADKTPIGSEGPSTAQP